MPVKRMIDLRTDTSSLPTEEMLNAMRAARLGNDGFGEDPTVNELEELAAGMLGKEAALLVPSGTQGNLVSLLTHQKGGMGLVVEEGAHIIQNEGEGYSKVAGMLALTVKGDRGFMRPDDVNHTIRTSRVKAGMLSLENTHNNSGGSVLPIHGTVALCSLAHEGRLLVHLDGSRIFNAAVSLGVEARRLAEDADSVMFCLTKGLCCPIGSLVLGTKDFITRARTYRRMLGGGMRQAGIIAAAGIVALRGMVDRLRDDHENAKVLATGLAEIPGIRIDPSMIQTNIVHFEVEGMDPKDFQALLDKKGIRVYVKKGSFTIRTVTYKDITRQDIHYVLRAVEEVITSGARPLGL